METNDLLYVKKRSYNALAFFYFILFERLVDTTVNQAHESS
jgi:hypothetical protein